MRIARILLLVVLGLTGCGGSGDGSNNLDGALPLTIRYLNIPGTTTDLTHVVIQGSFGTSFAPATYWQNQLTGQSGVATTWGEDSCSGIPGICTVSTYFEVDIPLAFGDNLITINGSFDNGATGSDSITITRVNDTTPPFVFKTIPAVNACCAKPDSAVIVIFNEEMDLTTLNSSTIKLLDSTGNTVSGTYQTYTHRESLPSGNPIMVGLKCDDQSVIAQGGHVYGLICDWRSAMLFTPSSPLTQMSLYTIFVGSTVTDLKGGHVMGSDAYLNFNVTL